MKRYLAYILIFLTLEVTTHNVYPQQSIGNLFIKNEFKGDRFFEDMYYEKAITFYTMALNKAQDPDKIRLKIGDSYRLLQDYGRAVYWYAQVMEHNPGQQESIYKYHYANMLQSTEEYDEALKWFEAYRDEVPDDPRPARKIEGLKNIEDYYIDYDITEVTALPINTTFSEIAPIWYKDGLAFISARENKSLVDQDLFREEDLYDVYFAAYDSTSGWGEVETFDKVLNTPFHEGPFTFYNGQDKLILTRSNYYDKHQTRDNEGKTRLQLYTAVKSGDLWTNIQPFPLNDPQYSLAHPALNETNDTLFFASDMPGGFGGTDIYMSVYNGDTWTEAINLGPILNTKGDELFPSYVSDHLFFSSDGHDGLGGLDVYKAAFDEGEISYITNIGSPVNSPMDDFSYSFDPRSKTGYFSSNREEAIGSDDIYFFEQKALILNGIAIQEQDRSPLTGAQINIIQDGLIISTALTGSDGSFRFSLPLSSDFRITASKDEHSFKTDLKLSTRGGRVDLDTLVIEMHKHDFFARGLVYDTETQSVMHDAQVVIEDEETGERDTVSTGLDGLYSFVIEPQKNYIIRAGKERFSSDSLRINTFSINKGVITNDFLLEEEYIDKQTVFFDFNEYELRDDAEPVLQKVLDVLKKYPDDWLIIGAHADARGTKEYNLELSEKRAKSVVEYFVLRGIDPDKIIARGFGEGIILNRCVDGVNCREEDHSLNRRAEIVVEEKLPEEELENKGF